MKNIFTKSIACLAMLFAASLVWAQDVIVTTDGQRIDAKIIEVSRQQVKYKESDNLDGPTFVLEVEEIGTITYASGKVVTYNQVVAVTPTPAAPSTPAATPAPSTVTPGQPAQVVDESTAEILLVSGQTITAQIIALQRDQIKYSLDGVEYILSADQVNKVTFVQNGQVRDYSATHSTPSPQTTQSVVSAADSVNSVVTQTNVGGRIYRDNGHYLRNDVYISSKEVARILAKENSAAYAHWQKADGLLSGGAVCVGIGGGLVLGGLFFITQNPYACIGMECGALVPLGIGLGLTLGASAHYNRAIDIYNSKYDQAAVQLKWNVAPNQVGLAIAF